MSLLYSVRIIPGVTVRYEDVIYRVVDLLSITEVLAEDETGRRVILNAADLCPDLEHVSGLTPNLVKACDDQWDRALKIYKYIQPLVDLGKERKREDVVKVATKANKHLSTVYRWLNDYESTGFVSSLIRTPRNDRGKKRLDKVVEQVVMEIINEFYLDEQRRSPAKVASEVRKVCIQRGLAPPDANTVRNRILEISEEKRMRAREGNKAADDLFEPIQGSFPGANFPLAVVQIDHTPMDVIIVDDVYRLPIGRPFLTIVIDIFSKIILGFYMSMDNPGALATGLSLSNSILGKEIYLSRLGLDHLSWPCWGIMRTIHTDNAKEFKGTLLGKAVIDYGMIAERRPKGRPKYGGHVERAFRTYMNEVHNELPGTTFSNVQEKMDYDSEGKAVMTMDALEKWFTIFLLGVYHQKAHKGNDGISPISMWEEGVFGTAEHHGSGIPPRVLDEDKLRLDFMPYFERTVQEYGIQYEGISYWTDALRRFIHAKDPKSLKRKRLFICRYDPRNLSKIWMFDEDANVYIEVPYRDLSRPAISIWELREAKKRLKEKSMASTNEELIFKSIDEMRDIVKDESHKTKKARRKQQKIKQWASAPKIADIELSKPNEIEHTGVDVAEDDFEDFEPFDDIRES